MDPLMNEPGSAVGVVSVCHGKGHHSGDRLCVRTERLRARHVELSAECGGFHRESRQLDSLPVLWLQPQQTGTNSPRQNQLTVLLPRRDGGVPTSGTLAEAINDRKNDSTEDAARRYEENRGALEELW